MPTTTPTLGHFGSQFSALGSTAWPKVHPIRAKCRERRAAGIRSFPIGAHYHGRILCLTRGGGMAAAAALARHVWTGWVFQHPVRGSRLETLSMLWLGGGVLDQPSIATLFSRYRKTMLSRSRRARSLSAESTLQKLDEDRFGALGGCLNPILEYITQWYLHKCCLVLHDCSGTCRIHVGAVDLPDGGDCRRGTTSCRHLRFDVARTQRSKRSGVVTPGIRGRTPCWQLSTSAMLTARRCKSCCIARMKARSNSSSTHPRLLAMV